MTPPEIFNRRLRRLRRDRAVAQFSRHAFLLDYIIDGLIDRLSMVTRTFKTALDLGCHDGRLGRALRALDIDVISADAGFGFARLSGGIQCDEDRLPFADNSFDLVMSAGVLDQVNDLPGSLAIIRRILKPDGLFLAGMLAAGSLPKLRSATLNADIAMGEATGSRMHPLVDVRGAGDLLTRAGFALPVADGEQLVARYADPLRVTSDLRGMALTNLLRAQPGFGFGKARLRALTDQLAQQAGEDGKLTEIYELVFLAGWAPAPGQPQPAARGSGVRSLTTALKPPAAK